MPWEWRCSATVSYTHLDVYKRQMQDGELPIFNWIWFGLWRNENGMNGYTYGMDVFGKDEMEVLGTDAKPSDLRDFLASLVSYVLENLSLIHI